MIGAVGAGKPVDVGHLPRSCHGDAEMVKHCSTADDCFAAGAVGGVKDAVSIEVEVALRCRQPPNATAGCYARTELGTPVAWHA